MMVASGDPGQRQLIMRLLRERYTGAIPFETSTVPSAVQALVTMHPDLVVADLQMEGHAQGGLRAILDAVSLGVSAVVIGTEITGSLQRRLRELGVGWVRRGADIKDFFLAVDTALRKQSSRDLQSTRSRAEPA